MSRCGADIPSAVVAPISVELRAVGTVGNMAVAMEISSPSLLDWTFSSGCDDPLLLGLHDAARREFTGRPPARDVILYQRTENQNKTGLVRVKIAPGCFNWISKTRRVTRTTSLHT